jgi:hypothetical protein
MKKKDALVRGVYMTAESETFVTHFKEQILITFEGIPGDRHAGLIKASDSRTPHYPRGTQIRNSRQISIVSIEDLQAIAHSLGLPEVRAEWLGANLLVEGIPSFSLLPPGTRLLFPGEATLVVEAENNPCKHPGKLLQEQYPGQPDLMPAFVKAALHRRGVVAWVERPGLIRSGDTLEALIPEQIPYEF